MAVAAAAMNRPRPWRERLSGLSLVWLVCIGYWAFNGLCYRATLEYYWLRDNPYIASAITAAINVGFMGVILGLRIGRFQRTTIPATPALILLAIYTAWSGFSLAWSDSRKPFESSVFYLATNISPLIIALELSTFFDNRRLTSLPMTSFTIGLAILGLQAVWFAASGRYSPEELLWYKNDYGHPMALMVILALHAWSGSGFRLRCQESAIAGVSLVVLAAVTAFYVSKTSMGALVAALAVLLATARVSPLSKILATVGLSAGMTWALWEPLSETLSKYIDNPAYAATLSERTVLWAHARALIADAPWFGHGFDSFRFIVPGIFNAGIAHTHNEWLMALVHLGVVGAALVAATYAGLAVQVALCLRHGGQARHIAVLTLALLVYGLIRGMTEADRFTMILPPDLVVLTTVAMARHLREPA